MERHLGVVVGAAQRVVSSLAGVPTLMVMVIFNLGLIGIAVWFLGSLEDRRHATLIQVLRMIESCQQRGSLP